MDASVTVDGGMRSSVLVRFVCTVDSPRSSLVELPQYPGCWHRARAGAGVSRRGRSSPSRPGGCGAWRARVVPGTARLEIRAESIYTIYDTCVVSILLVLIYSNPVRALISKSIRTPLPLLPARVLELLRLPRARRLCVSHHTEPCRSHPHSTHQSCSTTRASRTTTKVQRPWQRPEKTRTKRGPTPFHLPFARARAHTHRSHSTDDAALDRRGVARTPPPPTHPRPYNGVARGRKPL
jgi:hypothetical protein